MATGHGEQGGNVGGAQEGLTVPLDPKRDGCAGCGKPPPPGPPGKPGWLCWSCTRRARQERAWGSYLVNGKRPRHHAVPRVHEEGRRVHGWQLAHDLMVNVLNDFGAYWADAMSKRR